MLEKSLSINVLYLQANEEESDQSPGHQGEGKDAEGEEDDTVILEVGADPGESRATPTTAAGDGGMSDGDVGQAGGGNTLTANVSNRRSKVVWLFGHLLCLFVVRVECAPFICITTFVVTV